MIIQRFFFHLGVIFGYEEFAQKVQQAVFHIRPGVGYVDHDHLLQVVVFLVCSDISVFRFFLHAVAGNAAFFIRGIHAEPDAVNLFDFPVLGPVKVHSVLRGNETAHVVHGPLQERIGCAAAPLGFDVDNKLHQLIAGCDGPETNIKSYLAFCDSGIFRSFSRNPVSAHHGCCIGFIRKYRHRCRFRYAYDVSVPDIRNRGVFEFLYAVLQYPGQYFLAGKQLLRRRVVLGILTGQIDIIYGVVIHHTTSFTFILS